ncbi:MAG: hypothetical protein Q8K93_03160 [Reyranella sp.]|uniref:hypothetical protein n=1 Tax=Reyranella sp. TaxID=1929291 RepID=UPI0027319F8E|nr:hypothetical protein [Reyranella sp.]MDP1961179.1 hypothetical protein [Reyranella sp.]MDP2372932.1 hypothetical protein [Reyranella sp.]
MSHTLKLNIELGVIVLRAKQSMSFEEIRGVFVEMVRLPGFKEGLCLVADFRGSGTILTGEDIRNLAAFAERTDHAWGDTKWCIVASSDTMFGLSRMFSSLTDQLQVDTHVFRDIEAANGWLGLAVDVEGILAQTPDEVLATG